MQALSLLSSTWASGGRARSQPSRRHSQREAKAQLSATLSGGGTEPGIAVSVSARWSTVGSDSISPSP